MSVMSNLSDPSTGQETVPEECLDELHQPIWSVISFEKREGDGMVYDEAFGKLEELEAKGIAGLCVVTDSAAEKVAAGRRSKL